MQTVLSFQPERFRGWLMMLARTQLRNAGRLQRKIDASDLVQDVLLRAHQAWPNFQGNTQAELEAWLRQILARRLTDIARRYGRQKRNFDLEQSFREQIERSSLRLGQLVPIDATTPSAQVLREERAQLIAQALLDLPEDQSMAIQLHYLSDLSVAETASEMERSAASVAGLLRRGLQALRQRVEQGQLE